MGPLTRGERNLEVAGAVKLALEQGLTIVFLYSGGLGDLDTRFLKEFVPDFEGRPGMGQLRAPASKRAPHPAFREYLTMWGQSNLHFFNLPDGAEALAYADLPAPLESGPTAFFLEIGSGCIYVLPYHFAGSPDYGLQRLIGSILEHREGRLATFPPFFDELLVPGEQEVRAGIEKARDQLGQLEAQQADLIRHKLLVGHLSGEALEEQIIENLNLVLEGSNIEARDVEESGGEDFELVSDSGVRVAIAESKAVAGGVTLSNVNQVDTHRSKLDVAADELPGLLVVNTFRNNDMLDRRRDEEVGGRVIRNARRLNVLVIRTWDLYQLVVRRLQGLDDSGELVQGLQSGGGWLKVDEGGPALHEG